MTSPRAWFAKRPPPKELSHPISNEKQPIHVDVSKGPFKFNTFAAVMGKKPKKHSLAFQDESTLPTVPDRTHPVRYTNRPPSKSISSTVRSGDSSEPLTPLDLPRDHRVSFPRSVFTLSDADPFAAGTISLPQGIPDSTRFSVFSSSSGNDGFSKNDPLLSFDSSSFASTSSLSPVPYDIHDRTKPLPDPPERSMAPLLENADIDIRLEDVPRDRWDATIRPPLSKSGSFATLTDKTSSENHTPRLHTRPRGYTESSSSRPTTASSHQPRKGSVQVDNQLPVSFSHLEIAPHLTRKLSNSRLVTQPPTAPPIHDLPPTPSTPLHFDNRSPTSSGSVSVSRRTNGSESGPSDETKRSSGRPREPPRICLADIFAQPPSSKPPIHAYHTLKKSMSHSTLQKTRLVDEVSPPASAGNHKSSDRDFKKQNALRPQSPSFPQICQPSALFTTNPFNPYASETNLPAEPKRSITNSPPVAVRRRLFSASSGRRPSLATAEDDSQSVFSLPTDAERVQGLTSLYAGSLLDEVEFEVVPSGPVSPAADYAQQIMSPAEMLKVEAMVQSEFDGKYGQLLRPASFTSASTPPLAATNTEEGLSTAPTSFSRFKGSCGAGSPLSAARPSTAQDSSSTFSSSQSPLSSTGLPPPPRVRSHSHTTEATQVDLSGRRLSSLPANPLSPPPRKRTARVSPSGEKAPPKSVIRKPSFLEINDAVASYDGSFLDLDSGKDSFDLLRDEN